MLQMAESYQNPIAAPSVRVVLIEDLDNLRFTAQQFTKE